MEALDTKIRKDIQALTLYQKTLTRAFSKLLKASNLLLCFIHGS